MTLLLRRRARNGMLAIAMVTTLALPLFAAVFVATASPASAAPCDREGPGRGEGPDCDNEGPSTETTTTDSTEPSEPFPTLPTITLPEPTTPTTPTTAEPDDTTTTTEPDETTTTTARSSTTTGGSSSTSAGRPPSSGSSAPGSTPTASSPNRGFWGFFAPLSSSRRVRASARAKGAQVTPLITAAKNKAKPAKKRNAVTKPKGEVRGISAAAAPRSLSDATRADTHDRAMPDRLRIGLVALAALVLVVVLLVPRGPAALFSHGVDEDGYPRRARLRRRAAVAIMPGAGRRHS